MVTMVPLILYLSKRWSRFLAIHSTISSLSTDPEAGYISHWFTATACTLAFALSALLLEEAELHEGSSYYWVNLTASLCLLLVGLCPTAGSITGPSARKHWFSIGKKATVPMVVPTFLHCFGALYFMISHSVHNVMHALTLCRAGEILIARVLLGLSISSTIFLVAMIAFQAAMILRHRLPLRLSIPAFLLPAATNEVEQVTIFLHSASFVSELGTLSAVVLTSALVSTLRRDAFSWICTLKPLHV